MNARSLFSVALSAMFVALYSLDASADSSAADSAYGKMMEVNLSRGDSIPEKLRRLETVFDESFAPLLKSPERISDDEVRQLYGASDMLASYTMFFDAGRNAAYVGSMGVAFRELRRRSIATDADAGNLFDALVASRRFEEAALLKRSSPALSDKNVPIVAKAADFREDAPAEMALVSGREFSLRNVNLDARHRIVVVSGCHISEAATKAIDGDPALRDAFARAGAIWLAPADRNFDGQAVQRWNNEFPRQGMTVAYRNETWKGIDFSQIPAFYFYKDGKLVAKHTGWQKRGVPPEIAAALRSMGLLTD